VCSHFEVFPQESERVKQVAEGLLLLVVVPVLMNVFRHQEFV
jgi:hypothetical protein